MAKLTPKQQRFVDEYLIDLNATQAAIRAGQRRRPARVARARRADYKGKPELQAGVNDELRDCRCTSLDSDRPTDAGSTGLVFH